MPTLRVEPLCRMLFGAWCLASAVWRLLLGAWCGDAFFTLTLRAVRKLNSLRYNCPLPTAHRCPSVERGGIGNPNAFGFSPMIAAAKNLGT